VRDVGFRPETEAELSALLRDGTQQRFSIEGGGTKRIAGGANAVLSSGGFRGISLYEPGALTLVAGAGTPVAEVQAALAAEGQMLPFEPMDYRRLMGSAGEPTIGGMAAANVSGPRRIMDGACRDSMIGVRFVDGRGEIVKNGGRVMKNVTGYDLVKLMAGAFGTLGVLTEIAFKVLPQPEMTGVCRIDGLSEQAAVAAMTAALTSPYNVSGAAHLPVGMEGTPVTLIRVDGFEESVTHRTTQLLALLKDYGEVHVETDQARTAAAWDYVRDVAAFADRPGDVWRISVKPSDGPDVADALRALADVEVSFDWGGGLLWVLSPEDTDLRPALVGFGGHATVVRGAAALPRFQPMSEGVAKISAGLRAKFDPDGRLNPGLLHA